MATNPVHVMEIFRLTVEAPDDEDAYVDLMAKALPDATEEEFDTAAAIKHAEEMFLNLSADGLRQLQTMLAPFVFSDETTMFEAVKATPEDWSERVLFDGLVVAMAEIEDVVEALSKIGTVPDGERRTRANALLERPYYQKPATG